jgi:hypothetical protein
MDLSDRNALRLSDVLKEACRQFNQKGKERVAKLYNRNGLEILDEDI